MGASSSESGASSDCGSSAGDPFQVRVSDLPGKGDSSFPPIRFDHGGGYVAKADGLADDPPVRYPTGKADEERHMDLGLIEAHAVAVVAVFAELLSMVGGEDQQRLIQDVPCAWSSSIRAPRSRSSAAMQSS